MSSEIQTCVNANNELPNAVWQYFAAHRDPDRGLRVEVLHPYAGAYLQQNLTKRPIGGDDGRHTRHQS